MNNKGFTLVELLAVMVILISISLVTVASVTSSLTRREGKECQEQQELAVGAAKIYFSMVDNSNVVTGVTVGTLIDKGYLDSKYVTGNNARLVRGDRITLPNGANKYKINSKNVGDACSK